MEVFRSKSMKALSIALIAGVALIVAVIVITFSGASKRANGGADETTTAEAVQTKDPTADLGYADVTTAKAEESTEEPESTEAETEAPVYELAFSSNGDGTCTVTGLGTYRQNEVVIPTLSPTGDIVTAVGRYAFYNKTSIIRISLPSTIRTIGEYAFSGCSSLLEISVTASNTAFKTVDGILYTRDGSRLICCPAMRGKTTCTIGKEVAVIESGAFSGVKNLKTVYYTGTAAEWTEINIYAHNEILDSIRLTCNYTESK